MPMPAQLGPYKIQRLLGQGGMGAVYLGVHQETGERAGVKTLSATLSSDEDFRQRFVTEIESLKKLRHPNIVQLFGWGEQDGQLFYAMEFVDGQSLHEKLHRGDRFSWQDVIRIGIETCKSLKHAHDNGIIHRDLKPANLLLDAAGNVKLTDFGIAKLFGQTQLTVEGGVVGTADFMAPEQALGQAVTNRCDLYSLGTLLFTLLAARPPFVAKSLPEVVHKVCYEPAPPLRRLAPDVPQPLEALISELLEKDPQRRPPTARALTTRLEAMQFGLIEREARRTEESPPTRDEAEFELPEPGETRVTPGPGVHFSTTRFAPNQPQASPSSKTSVPPTKTDREPSANNPATRGPLNDATSAAAVANGSTAALGTAALDVESGEARFTTVEDEELDRRRSLAEEQRGQRWVIAGLSLALVAVLGAVGWQFFQPASADNVYERINAVAQSREGDLSSVSADIDHFLADFPDDPRHTEVAGYREDLELERLARGFEQRARRLGGAAALSPVEQAYLEAVEVGRTRPADAAARLQAIIDVYGTGENDKAMQQVVTLARRQLASLKSSLAHNAAARQEELRKRLDEARALSQSDPKAAAAIYRGIALLYKGQPWAAELVQQAEAALKPKLQ